ncbi:CT20-domain-containing protein [Aspergillus uvarum CBS 121591]|uniref:CT20-domain-containing protein n=1 Tax=Aspergillus uvarum CBS 121591 TaxID=1448315 RepID=A0A319C1X8_9EURO|nr:CT20-domain-containing protein [Aspergillus uvarum CBS 121591]PYH79094.1 CT20-domain-containing protein [Aspergillus uvarum CBS 121591]
MPPRKKAKLTPPGGSTEPPSASAAAPPGGTQPPADYDPVTDPWTDEQETALLKGIIKWKPVGMHKHFRMIAISEFMKSQGYAPANAEHTRIPGIWKKLGTLYNLPALDEREDSLITETSDDVDGTREFYCPFELPEDEYGDLMFERRLAMEGSPSPDPSGPADSRRGSTVADTDEPRSSPAPSRGRKPGRGGRQGGRGTRSSRLQVEIETPGKGSGNGEDDGDSGDESDEGDEEGSDGVKDDSDPDEEADGDAGGSPTTRSTRAQTSRSKQKEKKGAGTGTRRGGRRRQA